MSPVVTADLLRDAGRFGGVQGVADNGHDSGGVTSGALSGWAVVNAG